jgi:hypothetical protein
MDKVSILVKIADKDIPLKVSAEDVDVVRLSEKEIAEKINELKSFYNVRDTINVLSMTLLKLMVEKNQKIAQNGSVPDKAVFDKLTDLESYISNYLKSN